MTDTFDFELYLQFKFQKLGHRFQIKITTKFIYLVN